MKKFLLVLLALGLLSFSLSACAPKAAPAPTSTPVPTTMITVGSPVGAMFIPANDGIGNQSVTLFFADGFKVAFMARELNKGVNPFLTGDFFPANDGLSIVVETVSDEGAKMVTIFSDGTVVENETEGEMK